MCVCVCVQTCLYNVFQSSTKTAGDGVVQQAGLSVDAGDLWAEVQQQAGAQWTRDMQADCWSEQVVGSVAVTQKWWNDVV